jgi:PAS domain S-box-containing protein
MSEPSSFDSEENEPQAFVDLPQDESYRQLLEAAPDALLVVDLHGHILFANQQTTKIFGYAPNELRGQPIELLIPARLHAAHRRHRDAYAGAPVQRPMGMDMTLIAVRKDGSEFPVEISLSPVRLAGVAVVSAAVRDVSWVQGAREAVKRAHYNAQIAQLGQLMIGARDPEDIAAVVPAAIASALRADASALYALNADHTEFQCRGSFGIPAALWPSMRFTAAPESGPGFVGTSGDVVIIEDLDADTRYALGPTVRSMGHKSAIGMTIAGDDGPVGMMIARFGEHRKFSEDDRNFMRSAANIVGSAIKTMRAEDRVRHSQRLEAVGQLSGGIAHDFNNLLTVIIGNLQLIEEDIAGNETIAQPVEAALRAAGNAAELTRKLLAFSRRQALRPRPIDVNERVGGMLEMIRRTLGERITILAHPDPGVPRALADPGQLETALLNLVVNARDAMPHGGRLTIETGTRALDADYTERAGDRSATRYVMIAVSDNGAGMPAEVVKRAFDPYFTTKAHGKGSGLGLSMVHGFAKQSLGHVALYSEPGHGTTVRLFLPVADEVQPGEARSARRPADATGNEAILMVEDNEEVRLVGSRFLADLGYRVYHAGDAEQALALLATQQDIKLLFTDIVLPGRFGGKELAAEARRLHPDLALLFTSGYASGAIEGVDRLPGALLDKPYRRDSLAAAVRAALDRR